jgi:hypothetical protein
MKPTISEDGDAVGARRFRTVEERNEFVALFTKSGLSAAAFCREHGLCEQTFYYWRKQASRSRSAVVAAHSAPRFAEVTVAPAGATGAICINLPAGLSIEVHGGTDVTWLGRVVHELRVQG